MTRPPRPPRRSRGLPPEDWRRVEPLLDAAFELPPDQRAAFLAEVCAGDEELRGEVESLLAHEASIDGFLEEPWWDTEGTRKAGTPGEGESVEPDPVSLEGRRLGPYRLGTTIGQGGMGQVVLAERADGLFHRQVALKLLRPSLAGSEAAVRFEVERRTLARLEHPGIARLIDAGLTSDGRPYLVTEYVAGQPIDAFSRQHGLPVSARLELFRQVGEAVHHAHRNLLVHRDLKPSNILVTPGGRVKLLDFGIAKVLDDQTGSRPAPETRPGRVWVTPEYAAPEQLTGATVTTATDVYQLGVLLFELLSGRRPWQDREHTLWGLERAILEFDPPPPSTVLTSSAAPDFRRRLRGDLDAIVLKALRRAPDARYPSVRAMLDDLERFRSGRPVRAREGNARYRAGRFVRRHRVETLAASAVAVALLAGVATTSWQAGEARRERDSAREARAEAELALSRTQDVTAMLLGVFQATDPWQGSLTEPGVAREFLRLGMEQVDALEAQPAIQASLLDVLSQVQLTLGEASEAEALVQRALLIRRSSVGEEHPSVAEALNTLGLVRRAQGRFHEADALHREALELQIRDLGGDHPAVARTLTHLASYMGTQGLAEAERLHRRALEIRRTALGPSHPLVAESLRGLGRVKRVRGEPDEAVATFTEALGILRNALGPDHPEVAAGLLDLANLLRLYDEEDPRPEALYRRAIEIQRAAFGRDYPGLTHGLENLAWIHSERGEHAAAEALLREGLDLRRRVFGPGHRAVAEGTGFLAAELQNQGRLEEAERLRREETALWEAALGPEHWNVAGALSGLARILTEQGRLDEAEALYLRAMDLQVAARGERHGTVAVTRAGLGWIQANRGNVTAAESAYLEALDILLEERTDLNPEVRRLRSELARLYDAWGRAAEARELRILADVP